MIDFQQLDAQTLAKTHRLFDPAQADHRGGEFAKAVP